MGTLLDAYIINNGNVFGREINIWDESEYMKAFLKSRDIEL